VAPPIVEPASGYAWPGRLPDASERRRCAVLVGTSETENPVVGRIADGDVPENRHASPLPVHLGRTCHGMLAAWSVHAFVQQTPTCRFGSRPSSHCSPEPQDAVTTFPPPTYRSTFARCHFPGPQTPLVWTRRVPYGLQRCHHLRHSKARRTVSTNPSSQALTALQPPRSFRHGGPQDCPPGPVAASREGSVPALVRSTGSRQTRGGNTKLAVPFARPMSHCSPA